MNSRLLVQEPGKVEPPPDRDPPWVAWALVLVGAAIAFCLAGTPMSKVLPQDWPEGGPSEVFGQTLPPEAAPLACPACQNCESGTWLAQFVHHLDSLAENPREIRDVLNRCYTETRLTPVTVSDTGDWGICQINARAWPDVDVERLLVDPEYAAGECLRIYRVYYKACGSNWQCCYRRGLQGGC